MRYREIWHHPSTFYHPSHHPSHLGRKGSRRSRSCKQSCRLWQAVRFYSPQLPERQGPERRAGMHTDRHRSYSNRLGNDSRRPNICDSLPLSHNSRPGKRKLSASRPEEGWEPSWRGPGMHSDRNRSCSNRLGNDSRSPSNWHSLPLSHNSAPCRRNYMPGTTRARDDGHLRSS